MTSTPLQKPPSRPWTHWLISVVVCLLACVGAMAGFQWLASLRPKPAKRETVEPTYNVEVFNVERTDLIEVVSGFGTARADQEVTLAAQVSGEVIDLHPKLEVGLSVNPPSVASNERGESQRFDGDVLVRIDPTAYQERVVQAKNRISETVAEIDQLRQLEANNQRLLKKAREDLATIQEEHDRVRESHKRGGASASDLTRSLLELKRYEDSILQYETQAAVLPLQRKTQEQRLDTQQADVTVLQLDVDHTVVRPSFEGTVSEVLVERGQFVRAGDRLIRVTNTDRIEIPVSLAIDDFLKLQARLKAGDVIPVDLAETETAEPRWQGRLLRAAPEADPSTRTIDVFVEVDNSESETPLLPGTFVNARIDGPNLDQVIVIPRDALVGSRVFVVGSSGDRAEAREVQVSRTLQTMSVISTGLDDGDQVIVTNQDIIGDHLARQTADSVGPAIAVRGHRRLIDELESQTRTVARRRLTAERQAAPQDVH